jgi:hypothetical protein
MKGTTGLKTALICGAGHSGSTLLGMLLGSHSRAFYMGEGAKVRYLGDKTKPLHKRACKICGEACSVWGDFHWDRSASLHHQVAAHVGRDIIIDSTKNDAWIAERTAETCAAGGDPYLILLLRDGRGVLNSRLRKYPERDPETLVRDWIAQMERSRSLYDGFNGPKIQVRYETLATRPEPVMRSLCDMLGIGYEDAMLHFHAAEHHPLGGNNGPQYMAARTRFQNPDEVFVKLNQDRRQYYETHDAGIRLDLRWKRELSAENLAIFDRLAGDVNIPAMQGD